MNNPFYLIKETINRLRYKIPDNPQQVQIEITNRCNMDCPMCQREDLGIELEHMTDIDGRLLKQETKAHAFKIKLENGDEAFIGAVNLREYLDSDYEIVEGNIIAGGYYESK